ncbi:MAG TPA: hypothetical protein VKZ87_13130 [Ferrovibrio sp.]|jgi:hypothetical protein|nr:hypothetical protein [Ferrovibrio sp.]HLT78322.1 hypothetical protein [Ferrovibrio sp.]
MVGTILIATACIGNGMLLVLKLRMMRHLAEIESPVRKISL